MQRPYFEVGDKWMILRSQLNPRSRVLLEKLTVTQLVKKFPAFMGPEGSLPSSKDPATGPYPEPDKSGQHLLTRYP
jgi:hypothetical protein